MMYVDVVLPLPLRQAFTYEVNEEQASFLQAGMRVVVPFGKSKFYTAIALRTHSHSPSYPTKPIEFILEETPILSPKQLDLFSWISSYYLSTFGEVLKMGLPSALLLESESVIEKTEQTIISQSLSDEEFLVYDALSQASALTAKEVEKILQKKNPIKVLKSLLEKGAIRLTERIFEKYQPKLQKYLRFTEKYQDKKAVHTLLDENSLKTKTQEKLLWAFISLLSQKKASITPDELLQKAEVGKSVLKKLIDLEILEIYTEAIDRVSFSSSAK